MVKCPHLGCHKEINGITGLREVQNLIRHFKRVHNKTLTMQEALEIRSMAENMEKRGDLK